MTARCSTRAAKKSSDKASRLKQGAGGQKAEVRKSTIARDRVKVQPLVHRPLPTPETKAAPIPATMNPRKLRKFTPAIGILEPQDLSNNDYPLSSTAHYGMCKDSVAVPDHIQPQQPEYHV